MSDPTVKAINEIFETKTPIKEQIRRYKRYGKNLLLT